MKNYSRQREAILAVLRATDTHPTAAQVYNDVRKSVPNISLGTVYRNLSELSGRGDILSISVGDGFEHFDGDASPHLHLCCRKCGSITDARINDSQIEEAARRFSFKPETAVYVVNGLCSECCNDENDKKN